MLMRGEIMSAGQANAPQRKILTANQAMTPSDANMADEPTGTRNNYLNNMLDGIQVNAAKKVSPNFLYQSFISKCTVLM